MKRKLENILLAAGSIATVIYFTFCFQVWAAGYDSLYQYFSMMR